MKLVQLLAKELKEWPQGVDIYAQDANGQIYPWVGIPSRDEDEWLCEGAKIHQGKSWFGGEKKKPCDDHMTANVTKSQWQAEREKMNKPKWIRHRGGWMPVSAATIVEVRLRCGDIQKHEACEFLWRHKDCDSAANIMAYRVIEETKDQEIEEVIPKHMAFGYASKEEMVAQIGEECPFSQVASTAEKTNFGTITYKLEIDATEATQQIDSLVEKWGQIESPLKWRDEIIELEAYEEEFRREREKLIRKLESEGLKLIDHVAPVYGFSDIDFSDWRNWQEGDVIEVTANNGGHEFENGAEVTVINIDEEDATYRIEVTKDGEDWWLAKSDGKFIRRP